MIIVRLGCLDTSSTEYIPWSRRTELSTKDSMGECGYINDRSFARRIPIESGTSVGNVVHAALIHILHSVAKQFALYLLVLSALSSFPL